MNKPILLLRLSYWIAAIADFVVAVLVLIPVQMGLTEVVYPMGLTSAIAFSWGVLLIIADRNPMERRWVLIPTALVVGLLTLTRAYFSYMGLIEFSLAFLVFGISLMLFMIYSYYCAGRVFIGKS